MFFKKKILFPALFLLTALQGWGQANNNSPYSQYGLGDFAPQSFISQTAMGGVGVSNGNGISISNVNPALLVRSRFTVLDLGAVLQFKNIRSSSESQTNTGGNLQYVALAFPVSKKWTSGLSLQPYSTVNYKFNTVGYLFNTTTGVQYTYTGSGGLTAASFTNSVQLNKLFSFGLKISYLFGNISAEEVKNLSAGYTTATVNRINHSDFAFKTGLAYRQKLKEKLYINAGLTYDLSTQLNAKRFSSIEIRRGSTLTTLVDTVNKNQKGYVRIPGQYQAGISFDNPYHWTLGIDFTYFQGTQYRNFDNKQMYPKDGYTIAAGGDWTPNVNAATGFFNRVTYKAGFSYTLQPLVVNSKQLDDMSVSAGAVFPVGRGFSFLNVAFTAGQRGTTSNSLLKEQYLRANLGITINDRWFQKRKID